MNNITLPLYLLSEICLITAGIFFACGWFTASKFKKSQPIEEITKQEPPANIVEPDEVIAENKQETNTITPLVEVVEDNFNKSSKSDRETYADIIADFDRITREIEEKAAAFRVEKDVEFSTQEATESTTTGINNTRILSSSEVDEIIGKRQSRRLRGQRREGSVVSPQPNKFFNQESPEE